MAPPETIFSFALNDSAAFQVVSVSEQTRRNVQKKMSIIISASWRRLFEVKMSENGASRFAFTEKCLVIFLLKGRLVEVKLLLELYNALLGLSVIVENYIKAENDDKYSKSETKKVEVAFTAEFCFHSFHSRMMSTVLFCGVLVAHHLYNSLIEEESKNSKRHTQGDSNENQKTLNNRSCDSINVG